MHPHARSVPVRPSLHAGSRLPALARRDGFTALAESPHRRGAALAERSPVGRLQRSLGGPGRANGRAWASGKGGCHPRCRLRRLRPRLLRCRRRHRPGRPRGDHLRRRRDRRSELFAGRGRADRRDLGRQEQQRVEVSVRLGAPTHAEVDVGHRELGLTARADDPDETALSHRLPAPDRHLAEMQESDRIAVLRPDRDGAAAHRHGAGERDDPGRRREHRRAARGADVDPSMLSGCVRVVAQQERPQHRSLHGPRPAEGGCRYGKRGHDRCAEKQSKRHRTPPRCQLCQRSSKVAGL